MGIRVFLIVDEQLDFGSPKVTKVDPRWIQNRGGGLEKRGLKTDWFSGPEQITKMTDSDHWAIMLTAKTGRRGTQY